VSHPPGTLWFYTNCDFNALGTIYRRQTGEDIFRSFAERIAQPIGMEDFSARDGRYVAKRQSEHAAPFRLVSVPGTRPSLASFISMEGAQASGRSFRWHG
jgi:CubicO group peptidase (beta-lactamase class C family)